MRLETSVDVDLFNSQLTLSPLKKMALILDHAIWLHTRGDVAETA
jgi:hypothetical protein